MVQVRQILPQSDDQRARAYEVMKEARRKLYAILAEDDESCPTVLSHPLRRVSCLPAAASAAPWRMSRSLATIASIELTPISLGWKDARHRRGRPIPRLRAAAGMR